MRIGNSVPQLLYGLIGDAQAIIGGVPLSTILGIESPSVRNVADATCGRNLLGNEPDRFDVLITSEPWRFEPFPAGLRVLYVSDAVDREFLQKYHSPRFTYLQKPFRFQELLLSVHLLAHHPMERVAAIAVPCQSPHP